MNPKRGSVRERRKACGERLGALYSRGKRSAERILRRDSDHVPAREGKVGGKKIRPSQELRAPQEIRPPRHVREPQKIRSPREGDSPQDAGAPPRAGRSQVRENPLSPRRTGSPVSETKAELRPRAVPRPHGSAFLSSPLRSFGRRIRETAGELFPKQKRTARQGRKRIWGAGASSGLVRARARLHSLRAGLIRLSAQTGRTERTERRRRRKKQLSLRLEAERRNFWEALRGELHLRSNILFPLLFLFTSLLLLPLAFFLYFRGPHDLYPYSLALWLFFMFYALRRVKERLALCLFSGSFFIFLMGRDLLMRYFLYKAEPYSWTVQNHCSLLVILGLLSLNLSYCAVEGWSEWRNNPVSTFPRPGAWRSFLRERIEKTPLLRRLFSLRVDTKVLLVFFYFTAFFALLEKVLVVLYVAEHGYIRYYREYSVRAAQNPFLSGIAQISVMYKLLICLLLAFPQVKKRLPVLIHSVFLLLTLLTGQRFPFVSGFLLFLFIGVKEGGTRLHPEKRRRVLWGGAVFLVFLVFVLMYVEKMRGTGGSGQSGSVFLNFLYKQGYSVNVIKKAFYLAPGLPQEKYYSLSFMYYGFFAKFFHIPVYHGNTVQHALHGASFAHALTYIAYPRTYLLGVGLGSSFLAEAYFDFGYVGAVLWSAVYGILLRALDTYKKNQPLREGIKLLLLPSILWAPRGECSGFLSQLLAPSTVLCFFLLFAASALRMRRARRGRKGRK